MSRPSQLPPRCPLQKKAVGCPTLESNSFRRPRVDESGTRHQKSLSQSSMFDDQPAWLDDLLGELDSVPKGIVHCRSASNPETLFRGFLPNMGLSTSSHEERTVSKIGDVLESACVYGPNSPRRKLNVEFSDISLLSALSDYVTQSPMQFVEQKSWKSMSNFDTNGEYWSSPNEINCETKTGKRHPAQRSRARKLQYIAELEQTANAFQTLESELALRVFTLLQHRADLSLENSKLKQKMARLHQEKLRMEGEYQTLKKEAERLKLGLASTVARKICTFPG